MYLTKEYLFSITDIDTQRNLQEFFGRTKITRIQRGANPKAKPDVREEEIELIDDNVIKMLEIGHHITYMPKDKGTLYVGYTRYPHVPKTQEGYIRQGRDTEDDFILFKQGILKPSTQTQTKEAVVPEVLYRVVPDKELEEVATVGIVAPKGDYLALDNIKNMSLILQIDTKKMQEDGYRFIQDKNEKWYTQEIPSQYISILK